MAESDKFWDKTAARYAKSPVSDEATYQKKLAETQRLFTPNMRILEFGCGTGTTAVHHAPHVQHIDAIDISENMLEIGRGKAREAGIENIKFTRGTLTEFNADGASLDAVLGLNVIHLLPDRQAVVAEVAGEGVDDRRCSALAPVCSASAPSAWRSPRSNISRNRRSRVQERPRPACRLRRPLDLRRLLPSPTYLCLRCRPCPRRAHPLKIRPPWRPIRARRLFSFGR